MFGHLRVYIDKYIFIKDKTSGCIQLYPYDTVEHDILGKLNMNPSLVLKTLLESLLPKFMRSARNLPLQVGIAGNFFM